MKPPYQMGMAIAICTGVGVAIGVSQHAIAVWTAVGAGVGAAFGAMVYRRGGD